MDSLIFLGNWQYCSDSIVSLCCGLNFSFKTLNSPVALLHSSSSALVRVWMNCSPSLPNQFFMTGTFSSSLRTYASAWSTYTTSISTFNSSTCLSGAFQLNADWLIIGLACLGLWCSFWMVLLSCGLAGGSASCIALTIMVAAWVSTYMIAACVPSEHAILFLFRFLASKFLCAFKICLLWIFICLGVLLSA